MSAPDDRRTEILPASECLHHAALAKDADDLDEFDRWIDLANLHD